jgi:hypothetical protein
MKRREFIAVFADVEAAAATCRVCLISHVELARCAEAATRAVDNAFDAARRGGALEPINLAYLIHRQAAVARGERVAAYGLIMSRMRKKLLAHAVRGETLPTIEELVETLLP